jgi:hypothetical protein
VGREGSLVSVDGIGLLSFIGKQKGDPDRVAILMPRTGIEQSQILPGNQAIPQKAMQKALQSIRH